MLYEVRTYDVRPNAVAEVELRLATALESRGRLVDLVGSFHTEIGPLNQIVQILRHAGAAKREQAPADVVDARSDVFVPFDVSPEIVPGAPGPFYEIRIYEYADGDLPKIVAAWEAALPGRLGHSPLVFVGSSETGGGNKLLHVWPYRSLDERWAVRARIREAGVWPPLAVARKRGLPEYELLRMENKIVLPSAYSPLQ
jgi:hypothetical protein